MFSNDCVFVFLTKHELTFCQYTVPCRLSRGRMRTWWNDDLLGAGDPCQAVTPRVQKVRLPVSGGLPCPQRVFGSHV